MKLLSFVLLGDTGTEEVTWFDEISSSEEHVGIFCVWRDLIEKLWGTFSWHEMKAVDTPEGRYLCQKFNILTFSLSRLGEFPSIISVS